MRARLAWGMLVCAVGVAQGCKSSASYVGPQSDGALIVVDTDSAVPSLVSRLRVDLYTDTNDRAWYGSLDVLRASPTDWPASFGVYSPDPGADRLVVVRLRAYPDGKTRAYKGERFAPRPTVTDGQLAQIPPPTSPPVPSLVVDGVDMTPSVEPQPLLAIDRLVLVHVRPGAYGAVRVLLHGACTGTMADLYGGATCVDSENDRVPLVEEALEPDVSQSVGASLEGTFAPAVPCSSAAPPSTPGLFDDRVCVPGGPFVFGSIDGYGRADDSDTPERVAILSPFFLDRYEVTVARYRAALAQGFAPATHVCAYCDDFADCIPDVGTCPQTPTDATDLFYNTFSASPLPESREAMALTGITWATARQFCQFYGGDLPTEAQWEYAAVAAGRPYRVHYPWGDDLPTCTGVYYARMPAAVVDARHTCTPSSAPSDAPVALVPVDWPERDCEACAGCAGCLGGKDVSAIGVVGMAGNAEEFTRDAHADFASDCWAAAGLHDPSCTNDALPQRTVRGGSWDDIDQALLAANRRNVDVDGSLVYLETPYLGFRCAWPSP